MTPWQFSWRRTWDAVWSADFVAKWRRLVAASADATIYHEPSLVRAWADTHGRALAAEPLVGVATRSDGVQVLLTFVVQSNRGRYFTWRAASAAGDGYFGYHNLLVSGMAPSTIDWAAFWQAVRKELADQCDHVLIRFLGEVYARGPFVDAPTTPSPVLDLTACADFNAVLARCSSEHRKDIQRQRQRIAADHGPLQLWSASSSESAIAIADFRERFLPAYGRIWDARDTGNIFDRAGVRPFAERVVEEGVREGWGQYLVLRAGSTPVAWHAGLKSRSAWYWWIPTYDAGFRAYSPGRLLLALAIEQALRENVAGLHMLTGEAGYKLEWRPERVQLRSLRWYSPTFKGAILRSYDRRQRLKRAAEATISLPA